MNDQVKPEVVEQPIDVWHKEFKALMNEAQKRNLFAPDVLFVLTRACNEIQHQMNSILFTHEHKTQEGE